MRILQSNYFKTVQENGNQKNEIWSWVCWAMLEPTTGLNSDTHRLEEEKVYKLSKI